MTPLEETGQEKGARVLLLAASFVVVVAGLRAASGLILPFLSALFLAMISLPLLNWLRSKHIPTPIAVAVTLIGSLAVLAGIVVVIGGSLRRFTAQLPKYKATLQVVYTDFLTWVESYGFWVEDQFTTELINPAAALDAAQTALSAVVGILSNFLLVLLTITLILFEAAGFPDKLQRAFGSAANSERYEKIREEVQNYLGIKTLVSLATGSLVAGSLAALGIDFPLLWGIFAFLLNYIPTLGSIIAAVPPVLLALVEFGPGRAVLVAVFFLTVNVIMGYFVEPYCMGRRLGISTLVVFMSLVFWGWIWGPLGMLLSVPLTMIVKIMLENTKDLRWVAILLGPSERT